jgi:hypothetical protein
MGTVVTSFGVAFKNTSGITQCDFIKFVFFPTCCEFKRSVSDDFTAKIFCLFRILKRKRKIFDIFG